MDLIEFRRALRRHARSSLIVAILVLLFGLFTTGTPTSSFAATSTVLVTPRAERFQLASASVLRVILPNVIVVTRSESLHAAAAPKVAPPYRQVPVVVDASFDSQASSLFVTATSKDPTAAIVWSGAIAHALELRMKGDLYLTVQVLDVAEGAGVTGKKVRVLGIATSFMLALLAFVLVAFGTQRLEESRDVAGALRRHGVRVLGALAASRRYRRKADQLSVIQAALAPDDDDEGTLLVTALDDQSLAQWLARRLDESEGTTQLGDPTRAAGGYRLRAVAGPVVEPLALRASIDDCDACVVAVDDRMSSVAEVVAAVKTLREAGIECRGVVLVHGSRHVRQEKAHHRERLASAGG